MLEEHSIFQVFRTSKYYFYFTILQLLLTFILLGLLLFAPQSGPHLLLETAITLLLLADMYFRSYAEPSNLLPIGSSSVSGAI
jgi:hypothetical protein